ncbi:MAG: hypothetical protein AAGB31_11505, partial [Bdellovibrio sp.]
NAFDEAEFLYVIRNFDKAMEFYTKAIAEFPANKLTIDRVEKAVFRKVFYFTRVKRDMKGLSESLNADLRNKQIPKAVYEMISSYKAAAQSLAGEKKAGGLPQKEEALRQYVQKTLKDELSGVFHYENAKKNLINLRLSGWLYEYLDKNPETSLRPEIFYWLSFCESRWNKGAYDFLPESYLKKCVVEFPRSPIAPKCYQEYKTLVTMGYTGSSGTHLPKDVQAELKTLQDLIEGIKDR